MRAARQRRAVSTAEFRPLEDWGGKGNFAWMCQLIRSHLSVIRSCKHSNECTTQMVHLGTENAAVLDGQELGESDLTSRKRLLCHVYLIYFIFVSGKKEASLQSLPSPVTAESAIKLGGILNMR